MSEVDVRDLAREGLPRGQFPAGAHSDFRLHMAPAVLAGIADHAKADDAVEICGVLVGGWEQDEQGPYALVSDYIRCDNAASKFAEVTFTHESWAQINKEMDSKYDDKRIVGWYHSHPDFGIFLSDRDCFIQQHFFSGAGQVAYVIDPVRDLEGVFVWRNGKPTPLPHFWAGSEVRVSQAVDGERAHREGRGATMRAMNDEAAAGPPVVVERASLPLWATLLAGLGVFFMGYLYAGLLSRSEEQRMMEGTVARFFNYKILQSALPSELLDVRKTLAAIAAEFEKLPEPGAEITKERAALAAKQRLVLSDNLEVLAAKLADIQEKYTLSREEQLAYLRIYAEQERLLKSLQTPPPASTSKDSGKVPANKEAAGKEAAGGQGTEGETKDDAKQSKGDD
jgi:proteasome lid subunit RPN8/RPN11